MEDRIASYTEAVGKLPVEAVLLACGNFKSGKVKGQSLRYLPTCPEFTKEAERCAWELSRAAMPPARRIELKPAKPPSPPLTKEKLEVLLDGIDDEELQRAMRRLFRHVEKRG
ncbi:hypothetical protein DPQ22_05640 [Candidatus Tokpelaia sp.]|nr:hypothetical protein DPQ22_05640 [Candidatus Tokpelaia sp.]